MATTRTTRLAANLITEILRQAETSGVSTFELQKSSVSIQAAKELAAQGHSWVWKDGRIVLFLNKPKAIIMKNLSSEIERMCNGLELTAIEKQAVIAAYRKGERKPLVRILRMDSKDSLVFTYSAEIGGATHSTKRLSDGSLAG